MLSSSFQRITRQNLKCSVFPLRACFISSVVYTAAHRCGFIHPQSKDIQSEILSWRIVMNKLALSVRRIWIRIKFYWRGTADYRNKENDVYGIQFHSRALLNHRRGRKQCLEGRKLAILLCSWPFYFYFQVRYVFSCSTPIPVSL